MRLFQLLELISQIGLTRGQDATGLGVFLGGGGHAREQAFLTGEQTADVSTIRFDRSVPLGVIELQQAGFLDGIDA
ncbi:hypothetical protein D3C80_1851390 [compost metagenome]